MWSEPCLPSFPDEPFWLAFPTQSSSTSVFTTPPHRRVRCVGVAPAPESPPEPVFASFTVRLFEGEPRTESSPFSSVAHVRDYLPFSEGQSWGYVSRHSSPQGVACSMEARFVPRLCTAHSMADPKSVYETRTQPFPIARADVRCRLLQHLLSFLVHVCACLLGYPPDGRSSARGWLLSCVLGAGHVSRPPSPLVVPGPPSVRLPRRLPLPRLTAVQSSSCQSLAVGTSWPLSPGTRLRTR